MTEIRFSVPTELLEEWLKVGDSQGMSEAAANRHAWMIGVFEGFEQNNKRLVSRRLTAKLERLKEKGEWDDDLEEESEA